MTEPVRETERGRRHPDASLAADHGHDERERDGTKAQLLLQRVQCSEADSEWKQLGDSDEMHVCTGRQRELHAKRHGKDDDGDRA